MDRYKATGGEYADTIRPEDRSVRVLAREQVIKAYTDKVPNPPGYSLTHLFMSYTLNWCQLGCVNGE